MVKTFDNSTFWHLVQAICDGQVIAFVGAGVRQLAKINCWFRTLEREYNSTRRGTYPS
jgi:hypothetical protein